MLGPLIVRGVGVAVFLEDSAATGVGGDQANNAAANAGAVYMY